MCFIRVLNNSIRPCSPFVKCFFLKCCKFLEMTWFLNLRARALGERSERSALAGDNSFVFWYTTRVRRLAVATQRRSIL